MIHGLVEWIMDVTIRSIKESEYSSPMVVINILFGGMSFVFFLASLILFGHCQWGESDWGEFYQAAIIFAGVICAWAAATWVVETYLDAKKEYDKNNGKHGE